MRIKKNRFKAIYTYTISLTIMILLFTYIMLITLYNIPEENQRVADIILGIIISFSFIKIIKFYDNYNKKPIVEEVHNIQWAIKQMKLGKVVYRESKLVGKIYYKLKGNKIHWTLRDNLKEWKFTYLEPSDISATNYQIL